jgi:hypothetical protein
MTPIKKIADLKLFTIFEKGNKTKYSTSVDKRSSKQSTKRQKSNSNHSTINIKPEKFVKPFDNARLNILSKNLKQIRSKATSNDCRNKDKQIKPKIPQSGQNIETIINKYRSVLDETELNELCSIKEVYYLGDIPTRNNFQTEPLDDEDGNFIIKKKSHINYRYEVISELGQGSFGIAIKCFDHKTKTNVCVKVVKSKKKFTHQAKVEINVLEHIKKNDTKEDSNIVKMLSNFMFRKHIVYII